jgi:hypothetical protein
MDADDGVEVLFAHVEDHAVAQDAGVVDDDVELAEIIERALDDAFGGLEIADALEARDRLAAEAERISLITSSAGERDWPVPSKWPPRSLTTTLAPCLASNNASSRPIPRPAPVTIATFPSSNAIAVSILSLSRISSASGRFIA